MRKKKQFSEGHIYHIYNRGVAKNLICAKEDDLWRFLQGLCLFNDKNNAANVLWKLARSRGELNLNILKEYIAENKKEPLVRILAYCIMDNHFHLLVEEIQEGGIVRFMQRLGTGYARYFNNKHKRVGPLFQGRFKTVLVKEDMHLLYLLAYINVINPGQFIQPKLKEEGAKDIKKILDGVEKYPWSSHLDYLGKRESIIIEKGLFSKMLPTPKYYQDLVRNVLEERKYQQISHLAIEQ
ncbi:MAG: transposase [Candidatus Pacebacteria bacterium]|nr:transposase [Candidatus Paceibacterota bacterium]